MMAMVFLTVDHFQNQISDFRFDLNWVLRLSAV